MPFFTVVIPLYNKEKYVENALKSILNQTFTDYEVLIINDCCTDNSIEKILPFLSEKVKLIHHPKNKGLSASRNTGIENATSNYITFLDADDLWKTNFLQTIHRLIHNFPEAKIFATNYEEIYPTKTYKPYNGSSSLAENYEGYINFFKLNIGQGIYNHGSVCVHKEVYQKVGNYDENINFSEDIDFNIRANFHFKLAYSSTIAMSYLMQIENQITATSIVNKKLPDYNKYKSFEEKNADVTTYINFEKYVLAKKLKLYGDRNAAHLLIKSIDTSKLNWKQKVLLKLPTNLLVTIDSIKSYLIKKGIKIATYSS
ncbi:glycosyltransferase family A protein [Flavobacterium sp.]|uniref:glycosyltransferase family 2 protein n=1 Tax=Flavobacterium sp. TaxID=239 RepID=UPI00260A22E9|nr:glycosyltransferase family A protein [Flavobacterium sp.]